MRGRECLKIKWLCVVLHTDLNFTTGCFFFSAKSINTFLGGKKGTEKRREVRRGVRVK